MSQADLIRAHAQKHYVEVARRAQQKTVTIVAGEVGRDLGLSGRMPNICQALQTGKFLEMAGIRLLDIQGPEVGASTCFHYAIEDGQPSSGGEPQLEPIRATSEWDRSPPPSPEAAVVIQGAASRNPNAGRLTTADRPEKEYSAKTVEISTPFNICVLGEVADKDLARKKLQGFFSKHGLKATDWDIEFISSRKLKNWDVLKKLKKGQSKFNLLVTGQIHHHSGKGNESANLLTELKKAKYVDHVVGSSPKDILTVDGLVEKLEEYLIPASHSRPSPKRAPTRAANERDRSPSPSPEGTVVIVCAARKDPNAGRLATADGKPVFFVADPVTAPQRSEVQYRCPDDIAPSGLSWRDELTQYNENYRDAGANPLGLLPAWRLYANPAYKHLVNQLGEDKVFILSGGWGLIPAPFLTPDYDITFSVNAEAYKRRRQQDDWYADLSMLPEDASHPIHFLGGKSYVPFFLKLTAETDAERVIHHVGSPPPAPKCRFRRFETTRRTNWHYECAMTLW